MLEGKGSFMSQRWEGRARSDHDHFLGPDGKSGNYIAKYYYGIWIHGITIQSQDSKDIDVREWSKFILVCTTKDNAGGYLIYSIKYIISEIHV